MPGMVETNTKSFRAAGAIAQHLRVKLLTNGTVDVAVATDKAIGTLEQEAFAAADARAVRLRNSPGTRLMVANAAITVGTEVFSAAAGKVGASTSGAFSEGYANSAASADGDYIEVVPSLQGVNPGSHATFTFTPAAGSANVSLITVQAKDGAGNNLAGVFNFDIWLSDAASGVAPSVTTTSGAVTAGASGVVLGTYTVKQSLRVQTNASGVFILSITDTAKTLFRIAATIPGGIVVSAPLITANYG